ncbi:MAG: DUF4114 domain-containing protein [Phycisphaerae bacterium]|nr:DUF4114 domain-containing protein [Phycisphaerae bacterium]
MKRTMILVALSAVLALNAAALAGPGGPPGTALQDVLNDITVSSTGSDPGDTWLPGDPTSTGSINSSVIVDSPLYYVDDDLDTLWEIGGTGASFQTVIVELATFASGNRFGIYDPVTMTRFELFGGSAGSGNSVLLSIDPVTGGIYLGSPAVYQGVNFSGNLFGFYLDSTLTSAGADNTVNGGGLFYSNTLLNPDKLDHMYAYQGGYGDYVKLPNAYNESGYTVGPWVANEYVLAFEDLRGDYSDWDYTDFVVMVESVNPVPVPGAVLLGVLGLSVAGARLRRRQS